MIKIIVLPEITCIWLVIEAFLAFHLNEQEPEKSQYMGNFNQRFWPLLLESNSSKLIQCLVSRTLKHMVNFKHMSSFVDVTIKCLPTCFVILRSLPWEDSIGEKYFNWQPHEVSPGPVSME